MPSGSTAQRTFRKPAYLYHPIPVRASAALSHRADTWGTENWLKEITCAVLSAEATLHIQLLDGDELFAECVIACDIQFGTHCEPVIDSSRYFALRIRGEEAGQSAVVGLGFRDRADASDFTSALDDHRQYLRRRSLAERQRDAPPEAHIDYSLKEGQKLKMKVPRLRSANEGPASASFLAGKRDLNLQLPCPQPQDTDEDDFGEFVG